ncbi:MAG: TrkH family potassium uptake protein [Chlamydiia bacterium]|nr:TrkH family potassium uptake protein [Chlamydiia bacterium]
MLFREVFRVVGAYLFVLSIAMLLPIGVGAYYQFYKSPELHPQPHTTIHFLQALGVCIALCALFSYWGRKAKRNLFRREAICAVVIIWLISPAVGCLPFLFSGTLKNPFQAYFEMASGFTTTGASIVLPKKFDAAGQEIPYTTHIPDVQPTNYSFYGTIDPVRDASGQILYEGVEALGKALLVWRSFSQWLGGVGIVVLFVAILPALGVGGRVLFQTEMPGPMKDALTPRIKETAWQLWKIYIGLTLSEIFLLKLTNPALPWFDTVTLSFSTLSTGGFVIRNDNVAHYASASTEWVITLFMFLGGVNFSLYYFALKGKFYRLYETEFLCYLFLVLLTCGICASYLVGFTAAPLVGSTQGLYSQSEGIRYASFQIISALTSTGFIIQNYDLWPIAAQVLMLICMFSGAMSGSTSGGIKIIRHYMMFRIAQYKTESLFHPEAVRNFRIGDREIGTGAAMMVLSFFIIIISLAVFSALAFAMDGIDAQTCLSLVACMINNAGIGFRMNGATGSCAFLSDFSLTLSSLLMILGRLEFFAILSMLIPAFWQIDK